MDAGCQRGNEHVRLGGSAMTSRLDTLLVKQKSGEMRPQVWLPSKSHLIGNALVLKHRCLVCGENEAGEGRVIVLGVLGWLRLALESASLKREQK